MEPQAPAQIEDKNGCWLDKIQWDTGTVKYIHMT